MLDREGYRPNVGIILLNHKNEVFWAKRIREKSWQFPQGGIQRGESPTKAMFRELYEETGLRPKHVKVLGRTREWLRYTVPDRYVRRDSRGIYKGQKQIWFLLRLVTRDSAICLRSSATPEFDAWVWHPYRIPLETVIEFKRKVYRDALEELSAFVGREPLGQRQGAPRQSTPRRGAGRQAPRHASAQGVVAIASRTQPSRQPSETVKARGGVERSRRSRPNYLRRRRYE